MKWKKPVSHRILCFVWIIGILCIMIAVMELLGFQTQAQVLRSCERVHSLQSTEIVLKGYDQPTEVTWTLSSNKNSILFSYYHSIAFGFYDPSFSTANDFNVSHPYCIDIFGIYTNHASLYQLFGAITDPNLTKIQITTDSSYAEVTDINTYTLYPQDMVYQNQMYYFVCEIAPDNNPYISNITYTDRFGTRHSDSWDKPTVYSPEFWAELQESEASL